MKENVKVDSGIVSQVRERIKETKQTIGGFFESAADSALTVRTDTLDNCDAFRLFLKGKSIKYKGNGHYTTVFNVSDPIALGVEFGIYKRENDPSYKK